MFRILALDGGGIKGAFTAAVLASLEHGTGRKIVDHFDLISGTSTGGILAVGLSLGLSAQELMEFYINRGPYIFPRTSLSLKCLDFARWLVSPKHSQETLRQELTKILGNRTLREARTRLVVPTYDAISGRIYIMKTNHHEGYTNDIDALAVDVALATSAAPTYFSAAVFPAHNGASYVDGGVWANCPALVAVVEALSILKKRPQELDVLSIGTTSTPFNISALGRAGILQWNKGLLDLALNAQAEASLAQASLLVEKRLLRIDAITPAGQFSLDDARPATVTNLVARGRAEAVKRTTLDAVQRRFLNGEKATSFVPISNFGSAANTETD